MTVRAPVDGRVYRLVGYPGSRIGAGITQLRGHDSSTIITLYQPEKLQIRVDVRFEDIPKTRLNQPVQIVNPALKAPLLGKVLFVSSEADIQKNTLQVKVEIPDPPEVFKPEMLVDVTFLASPETTAQLESIPVERIFVPQLLILSRNDKSVIWVADQSTGTARLTQIETGQKDELSWVEIVSGLTISSRLITSNTHQLKDGTRINITGESPESPSEGEL